MAEKRCEICGKGPVVGRNISHAHNVTPRRFEPNLQRVRALVNGGIQRLRVLHALPPLEQGRQGRLRRVRQAVSTPSRPAGDRPVLAGDPRRLAAVRLRADPARPGDGCRWSRAISRRRPIASSGTSRPSSRPPALTFDHVVRDDGLPGRHERFRGDERGLRHLLLGPGAGARDRPGGAAAEDARVEIDVIASLSARAVGISAASLRAARSTSTTPSTTAQRLDHLLQVLHVADLDGHVDAAHLVVDGGLDVADVGVDPGDLRADVGEDALAILDLDAQPDRVGRGVGALVPLDVDPPLGVVEQVDDVGAGRRRGPTRPCRG